MIIKLNHNLIFYEVIIIELLRSIKDYNRDSSIIIWYEVNNYRRTVNKKYLVIKILTNKNKVKFRHGRWLFNTGTFIRYFIA